MTSTKEQNGIMYKITDLTEAYIREFDAAFEAND
jgi:hypothetical protein